MTCIGKLLYISGYYLDGNDASTEHVREICLHLAEIGWRVALVGTTKNSTAISQDRNGTSDRLNIVSIPATKTGKYTAFFLWRAAEQLLRQEDFHLAYIRPARKTLFAVNRLQWTKVPYVVEINTNTAGEFRAMGAGPVTVALADWVERLQLMRASGAFCITEELADYARKRLPHHAPVWITGNGFREEVTRLAIFDPGPRAAVGVTEQETVLVFLGALQPWQGVNILLEALRHKPEIRLWVIGEGPEKNRLQMQACELGVASQIHWWGHQDGENLQRILSAADIAVGSLALYRKNMFEAQPLKVRHYLGVGLPTIIGYKDTLLSSDSPGVFYAQTAEDIAARVSEIQRQGCMRNAEYRQKIRNFALQNLSWAAIARQTSDTLLEWLESRNCSLKR